MKERCRHLTTQTIRNMNYNELIGITGEINKTPGGINTIRRVAALAMLESNAKILDIGTSTGHTSVELARLLKCEITGIDINEVSLGIASNWAKQLDLKNVNFIHADATELPFTENSFDMVFCGNVTSLIDESRKALSEYWRVTLPLGYIAAVPMYYVKQPPAKLVSEVCEAIKTNISVQSKKDWVDFFTNDDVEIFAQEDYYFDNLDEQKVRDYCSFMMEREQIKRMDPELRDVLLERYRNYMLIFRENLSYMGYSILLLRRKLELIGYSDTELFTSRLIA